MHSVSFAGGGVVHYNSDWSGTVIVNFDGTREVRVPAAAFVAAARMILECAVIAEAEDFSDRVGARITAMERP